MQLDQWILTRSAIKWEKSLLDLAVGILIQHFIAEKLKYDIFKCHFWNQRHKKHFSIFFLVHFTQIKIFTLFLKLNNFWTCSFMCRHEIEFQLNRKNTYLKCLWIEETLISSVYGMQTTLIPSVYGIEKRNISHKCNFNSKILYMSI